MLLAWVLICCGFHHALEAKSTWYITLGFSLIAHNEGTRFLVNKSAHHLPRWGDCWAQRWGFSGENSRLYWEATTCSLMALMASAMRDVLAKGSSVAADDDGCWMIEPFSCIFYIATIQRDWHRRTSRVLSKFPSELRSPADKSSMRNWIWMAF